MSCFENYIGIKSCELTSPKSGKFLEDLGISIVKLSGISNEANLTGVNYGTQKIKEAIDFVLADVIPDFTGVPVSGSLNDIGNDVVDYLGTIKLSSLCKDAKIRIDSVKANCQNDIDTILYIKDGSTITEIEFNTADTIYPNYVAKNKDVEVYINDNEYLPYNTLGSCEWVNNCCKDVAYTQGQTGLQLDFSLVCDFSCRFSGDKNFQNAVLYYTGVLISQDLRLSSNLNDVVTMNNATKSEDREDIWMAMYEKYAIKLRTMFIDVIDNSCCKSCDGYDINWNI
jgi:hypothetical protein